MLLLLQVAATQSLSIWVQGAPSSRTMNIKREGRVHSVDGEDRTMNIKRENRTKGVE